MTGRPCTAPRHGDYSAYRHGCRCPAAREDDRLYNKRRRQGRAQPRRIDRCGTARRLQALSAAGWRWCDLADLLGVGTWQAVQHIAIRTRGDKVSVRTATQVAALYARLEDTPGPSDLTRQRAAAKGWVLPEAWAGRDIDDPAATPVTGDGVDDVLVDLVLHGRRPFGDLNDDEQTALWVAWERRRRARLEDGPGVTEFARTFGLKKSRVAALRLAAAGLNTRNNPIHPDRAAAAA